MATGVKDIDRGWRKIRREFLRTKPELVVVVGIQGSEAGEDHDGLTNAQVGTIHEFGAPAAGIVERSWLRATIDRERKAIEQLFQKAAARLSIGRPIKPQLELIGVFAVAKIRQTFDRSIGLAPLRARTVARKGSTRPLIDTSQLKGAVTSRVAG